MNLLLSCDAGTNDSSGNSLAQGVADALDIDVYASIGTCYYIEYIGLKEMTNKTKFSPKKKKLSFWESIIDWWNS